MVGFALIMAKHIQKKLIVSIENISCAHCIAKIENSVSKMGGVESINVHLSTKTAIIKYDSDAVRAEKIISRIKELGYTPSDFMENEIATTEIRALNVKKEINRYLFKFSVSLLITLIIILNHDFSPITYLLLSSISYLYCASHFHRGFFNSLKNKSADMNTLVSLSSTVLFIYLFFSYFSEGIISRGNIFHWHELAMLITFLNLGKLLEAKSKERLGTEIVDLFRFFPKFASRIGEENKIEQLKTEDIKIGDRILLKAGENCPVDGIILKGFSYFDESMLNGESVNVLKKEGDQVFAGSLNITGSVEITAQKTGSDTIMAKIAEMVREGQSAKINIQKIADKISSYFVPISIFIAFFSAVLWFNKGIEYSVNSFVSVLVIACPCAMGIAVPMSIFVGFSKAVRLGFIINNPNILENFSKIDTLIMDKTGTMTVGRFYPVLIKEYSIDRKEFLKYLYTSQLRSEHIFSKSILNYCLSQNIEPLNIDRTENFPGLGIKVYSGEKEIMAGSMDFFRDSQIEIKDNMEENKSSIILLAVNKKYIGYILLEDMLRENILEVLDELKKEKIEVIIASGDRKKAVEKIAQKCGIEKYYYEVKPDEKLSLVLKYKAMGRKVMMLGDGINDAAALKEADIGVSMSHSSDLTAVSSDAVLLKNDLSLILKLLKLSQLIKTNIKQNLIWAFSYNILLVPLAAGIMYPVNGFILKPYMAAMAMGLSSISVVLNSLRLAKAKL